MDRNGIAPTAVEDRPPAPAYRLVPEAYLSDAWFAQERAALFTSRWSLVATAEDLSDPGSIVAVTVGSAPMLVVRGADGVLRAMHNLCRHRGMRLLPDGVSDANDRIACFYHQWRYGLDGSLTAVPQRREQFPDLDPADWGLLPASVGEWEGMVFVHPDPAAPPLADHVAPLDEHLGAFRPGALVEIAHQRWEIACNWKLFVENHIDIYHLWYLHAETLGDFDHTRFEHEHVDGNWFSYEPLRRPELAGTRMSSGAVISHLDERDRHGIGAHLLFPNLMVATAAEFFATYEAVPVAPGRTCLVLRVRAERGAAPEPIVAAVRSFIDEDVHACEQVQAAMASPAFAVGPLAREHERPITEFHDHLLGRMGAWA